MLGAYTPETSADKPRRPELSHIDARVSGQVGVLRNARVFENAQVSNDAKMHAGHVYGNTRANGGAATWNGHLLGDGDPPVSPTV